jgi:hypothetical protein
MMRRRREVAACATSARSTAGPICAAKSVVSWLPTRNSAAKGEKENYSQSVNLIMFSLLLGAMRRVSFLGVREVALVDLPVSAAEYVQRVGRAVRFNGHAGLPSKENDVRMRLYVAKLPGGSDEDGNDDDAAGGANATSEKSADQVRLQELEAEVKNYSGSLNEL